MKRGRKPFSVYRWMARLSWVRRVDMDGLSDRERARLRQLKSRAVRALATAK